MAKLLKTIALSFFCFCLLIIITATILVAILDVNDFKPQIQSLAQQNLNRQLTIKGDIELSLFPWIGFSATQLGLSNAPEFSSTPFAEAERISIKIKLLPLLSNKIEIQKILLKGLALNLNKNKQGLNNWDDLIRTKDPQSKANFSIDSLTIDGISIEKAKIIWNDQQQGNYTEIRNFSFNTGKLTFNHPILINSSLTLVKKKPEIKQLFHLSSSLTFNKSLDTFKLTTMTLDSTTHSKNLPLTPLQLTVLANVELDLSQHSLNISTLEINLKNLLVSAKINITDFIKNPQFTGTIKIPNFNPSNFLENLSITTPTMPSPKSFTNLSATFDIHANVESAIIQKLTIKLDDSTIKGSGCVKDYSSKPVSYFTLKIDTLNADNYFPKEQQNTSIPNKPLKTADSATSENTFLSSLDRLQKSNINGLISIDKLYFRGLDMQTLNLNLNTKTADRLSCKTSKQIN